MYKNRRGSPQLPRRLNFGADMRFLIWLTALITTAVLLSFGLRNLITDLRSDFHDVQYQCDERRISPNTVEMDCKLRPTK